MPTHKKKIRNHRSRRNPVKRLLSRYSSWFFGIFLLTFGIFLGSFFSNTKAPVTVAIETSKETKEPHLSETPLAIEAEDIENQKSIKEINKLTEQLILERKKTEELSEKLNNESIKLKDLLVKKLDKSNNNKEHKEALNDVEQYKNHSSGNTTTIEQSDYYNKVRISLSNSKKKESLQEKVNTLIEIKPSKKNNVEYIVELGGKTDTKENKIRAIRLNKGDSLWSLSIRAYGKGSLYTKILEANPHITEDNIQKLTTGTIIRVPQ